MTKATDDVARWQERRAQEIKANPFALLMRPREMPIAGGPDKSVTTTTEYVAPPEVLRMAERRVERRRARAARDYNAYSAEAARETYNAYGKNAQ